MNDMKRKRILLVVVLVIIAAIVYLSLQNTAVGDVEGEEIRIEEQPLTEQDMQDSRAERIAEKEAQYERAIELVSPDGYLNSEPFTLADHVGEKVILIDFWTYSCINCQRTLPHITSWHESYEDDGLLIVGVHTPEFDFEKNPQNVQRAMEKWGVEYPVVQDNEKLTFRAYKNRYWPRKYLIDIDGFIVYDHIGEGAYDETEAKIQELLRERADVLGIDEVIEDTEEASSASVDFSQIGTPEIYFGVFRAENHIGNEEGKTTATFEIPQDTQDDKYYLEGAWRHEEEYAELESFSGTIQIRFKAKQVNFVAESEEETTVQLYLDGEYLGVQEIHGADLYELVTLDDYEEHTIEIRAKQGLRAYTFTFG